MNIDVRLDMSNRLPMLAAEARAAHEDFQRSHKYSAERAVDAGRALAEAKNAVDAEGNLLIPRGGWERWVENEAGVPYQTAWHYMRLFRAIQDQSLTLEDIADAGQIGALKAGAAKNNHRAKGTGENEWFTPGAYIAAARAVMGHIDLDPASHPVAQELIEATEFYTAEHDGLTKQWHGRVWLNPPYAQPLIGQFVGKLIEEIEVNRVQQAILLTHSYTDTTWFHNAASVASIFCFTRGRIRFVDLKGDECNPTQGQAFVYFGDRTEAFAKIFGEFGVILRRRP